jgi:hypothetical protein
VKTLSILRVLSFVAVVATILLWRANVIVDQSLARAIVLVVAAIALYLVVARRLGKGKD